MKHIAKPAIVLFITAVIVVALVGVAYNLTLEPIAVRNKARQEAALKEVLPQADYFTELSVDLTGSMVTVFQGADAGYVIQLAPEGYSGKIHMMVGISSEDEVISGMRILRHTETPGFGSLATRETFYRKFDNKSLVPLRVAKIAQGADDEIPIITGSTITTDAIVDAVNEAMEWYKSRKQGGDG